MEPKIKILFVGANPHEISYIDVEADFHRIQEAEDWAYRQGILFEVQRTEAIVEKIDHELARYNPHIVHFSAHGRKAQEGLRYALAMHDAADRSVVDYFEDRRVLELLERHAKSKHTQLQLVLFNCCHSCELAEQASGFLNSAIGSPREIHDQTAARFSSHFYRFLASLSISEAYLRSFDELSSHPDCESTDGLPRLFTSVSRSGGEVNFSKLIQGDGDLRSFEKAPPPPKPFIGRRTQLEVVRKSFYESEGEWISIVGHGGIGKTAFCLKVADDFYRKGKNRIIYIDLTHQSSFTQVIGQIQEAAFNNRVAENYAKLEGEEENQILKELAKKVIRLKPDLIIVNNCEHVVEYVRAFHAGLEISRNSISVLATSIEKIDFDGENVFRLAPLKSGLTQQQRRSVDAYMRLDAVQLFIAELRRFDRAYAPTLEELAKISKVCGKVGGLPLGIKLLAGQCESMDILGVLSELDDVTTTMRRHANPESPTHHKYLEKTIAWSVNRCSVQQYRALRLLSVFPDGLNRTEYVDLFEATMKKDVRSSDLRGLFSACLVEKNASSSDHRFFALEPVRRVLDKTPHPFDVQKAWLEYGKILQAELIVLNKKIDSSEASTALSSFSAKEDNVLSAIKKVRSIKFELATQLCNAFDGYLELRVSPQVRIELLNSFFELEPQTDYGLVRQKCVALNAIGRRAEARDFAKGVLENGTANNEPTLEADIRLRLIYARSHYLLGDDKSAKEILSGCFDRASRIEDLSTRELLEAIARLEYSDLQDILGQLGEAKARAKRAVQVFQIQKNQRYLARAYNRLGLICWHGLELEKASDWLKKAARVNFQELKDVFWYAGNSTNLALLATDLGDFQLALRRFEKTSSYHDTVGNRHWQAVNLAGWGKAQYWNALMNELSRDEMAEGIEKLEKADKVLSKVDEETSAQFRGELGRILVEEKSFERGAELLKSALQYFQERGKVFTVLEVQFLGALAVAEFNMSLCSDDSSRILANAEKHFAELKLVKKQSLPGVKHLANQLSDLRSKV